MSGLSIFLFIVAQWTSRFNNQRKHTLKIKAFIWYVYLNVLHISDVTHHIASISDNLLYDTQQTRCDLFRIRNTQVHGITDETEQYKAFIELHELANEYMNCPPRNSNVA